MYIYLKFFFENLHVSKKSSNFAAYLVQTDTSYPNVKRETGENPVQTGCCECQENESQTK